nr:hypothetical protein [Nakamurella flavida]
MPGVAAAAALALSGCAAGQISQTAQQVAAIDGANADTGSISIRNVLLAEPERTNGYPAGSDARVLLYVSNIGLNADTLTSVSSSVAGSATIDGTAEVPPQTLVDMATDTGVQIALEDLNRDVFFGQSIPVTFTFENAGSMTVQVPVEVPTERSTDRPTVEILPAHPVPLWEEESHGEEGGTEGHMDSTSTAAVPTGGAVPEQGSEG